MEGKGEFTQGGGEFVMMKMNIRESRLPAHPRREPDKIGTAPKYCGRNPRKRANVKKPKAKPGIWGRRQTIQ